MGATVPARRRRAAQRHASERPTPLSGGGPVCLLHRGRIGGRRRGGCLGARGHCLDLQRRCWAGGQHGRGLHRLRHRAARHDGSVCIAGLREVRHDDDNHRHEEHHGPIAPRSIPAGRSALRLVGHEAPVLGLELLFLLLDGLNVRREVVVLLLQRVERLRRRRRLRSLSGAGLRRRGAAGFGGRAGVGGAGLLGRCLLQLDAQALLLDRLLVEEGPLILGDGLFGLNGRSLHEKSVAADRLVAR
mmetsp:Transcript_25948/g.69354  ORF Transcript_25948/g.69354 Transcript_25948/m.69354 type:complete len:245 (+) Transcript_25948:53-787(+)